MMNRRVLMIVALVIGGTATDRVSAGVISGSTLELNTNPLPGVLVEAFRVSLSGAMDNVPFQSTVSAGPAASYKIDLGAEPRVVLRFSAGSDRVVVFLPQPPNGTFGGAIDGRTDVAGLNVYVPRRVIVRCVPYYYPSPRRCFR